MCLPTNTQNTMACFIFRFYSTQSIQTENILLKGACQKDPNKLKQPSLLYCIQFGRDRAHTDPI